MEIGQEMSSPACLPLAAPREQVLSLALEPALDDELRLAVAH